MKYTSIWKTLMILICVFLLPNIGYAAEEESIIPDEMQNNPNIANIEVFYSRYSSYDPALVEKMYNSPTCYKGVNGLWGLQSKEGIPITEPIWDSIHSFAADISYFTVKKDNKWGLIDFSGTVVIEPQYKEIKGIYASAYEAALIRILTFEDKYGLLNLQLETVLPVVYDYVDDEIYEDALEVGRDYGFTIADLNGNELVPLQQNWVHKTNNPNYFICGTADEGSFYLIDKNGNRLTEKNYQDIKMTGENSLIVKENGLFGMIDISGKTIIPCQYTSLNQPVYEGVILAFDGINGGYFDAGGRMIGGRLWKEFEPIWYEGSRNPDIKPEDMLFQFKENDKYGFINFYGNIVAPPIYEEVNGRFIQLNGKTGMIANDGSYLIEPEWNISINRIHDDIGCYFFYIEDIGAKTKTGVMNLKGEVIIEPIEGNFYVGAYNWLCLGLESNSATDPDGSESAVLHITLSDSLTPLSDEPLKNPPLFTSAVNSLKSQKILLGDENGGLNLSNNISRAEFLTMLARAENWNDISGHSSFTDVQTHWAEGIISSAVNRGLVTGYTDAAFGPDDNITARQALTILFRAKNCPEYVFNDDWMFSDAYSYSKFTMGRGFERDKIITRKDAAILLYSYQRSDADLSAHEYKSYIIGNEFDKEPYFTL